MGVMEYITEQLPLLGLDMENSSVMMGEGYAAGDTLFVRGAFEDLVSQTATYAHLSFLHSLGQGEILRLARQHPDNQLLTLLASKEPTPTKAPADIEVVDTTYCCETEDGYCELGECKACDGLRDQWDEDGELLDYDEWDILGADDDS